MDAKEDRRPRLVVEVAQRSEKGANGVGEGDKRGGGEVRKRVDNSQDRIVPGAKNRSIPECYRMAETLASRVLLLRASLLLKTPPGENCFIRAVYIWQYQLVRLRRP